MTKAVVSGSIYAEDPIFSPHGYAKKVFGESNAQEMTWTVNNNKMEFTFPPVSVVGTDVDATLVSNITSSMDTEYLGNVYFSVTYS